MFIINKIFHFLKFAFFLLSVSNVHVHVQAHGILKSHLAATSLSTIINHMKGNDDGFFHLDNTGILRSFNRDNKVIDYQKLSKEDFNTLSKVYLNKKAKDSLKHWSERSSLIDDSEIWNPFHDRIPSFQLPELEANKESMGLQSRKLNILSPYRDLCTPLKCRWSSDCRRQEPKCRWCVEQDIGEVWLGHCIE
ncbi:hypothetical protein I7I48_06052 [Histoplasma ohiense]|nr:hypothetical protein I7I48_06052 [Histoplasma ohiense (nom. inval.)]